MKFNKIKKDERNSIVSGVCSGLAKSFDAPSWLVRLMVLFIAFHYPIFSLLAYVAASLLLEDN